jgi:hypothetical protein
MRVIRCSRDDEATAQLGGLLDDLGPGEGRAGGVAFVGAPVGSEYASRRRVPALIVTPEYVACVETTKATRQGALVATRTGQWTLDGRPFGTAGSQANPASRVTGTAQVIERTLNQRKVNATVFPVVLVDGPVSAVQQPDGSRPYELTVDQLDRPSLTAVLAELGAYAQRTGGHRTAGPSDVSAVVEALQIAAPRPDDQELREEGFARAAGWDPSQETLADIWAPPELPDYDPPPAELGEGKRPATRTQRSPQPQRRSLPYRPLVFAAVICGVLALLASESGYWLFGLPGVVFAAGGLIGAFQGRGDLLYFGLGFLGLAMSAAGLWNGVGGMLS